MSNFRDQFVGNTDSQSINRFLAIPNNSRENFGNNQRTPDFQGESKAQPYSLLESDSNLQIPLKNELSDFEFQLGVFNANNRYVTGEHHELSDLSNNPFGLNRADLLTDNPFRSSEDHVYDGYTVVPPANATSLDHSQESENEAHILEKHMLHSERNRRLLANRLPRFHYTKLPWFTILVTTAQVIVFIVELVKMGIWTGSPIQTEPYFNPMIGPSTYVLINMGARYVPCMHKIEGITLDTSIQFPCPNSTSTDTDVCNLNELCGLSGVPIVDNEFAPNQYYRILLPIFLHAGILHIFFNMILQLTMGLALERSIGWLKYSIIYIASGVAGFLLGANFSQNGVASTGASGSLFGVIAANFLLFIYCGTKNTNIYETKRYKTFITIMVVEIVVSFVLGLLPGLDNFSHIGGFCMGLLTSILLLPDPSFVFKNGVYTYYPDSTTWKLFVDNWNPLCKLQDKIPWKVAAWAACRVVSLTLVILYFALLTKNLKLTKQEENEETCLWCKYFNCIPVNDWCEQGVVTVTTSSASVASATPTTSSSTGTLSSSAEIFNAPTELSNDKKDIYDQAPFSRHETYPKLTSGAKSLAVAARSDLGSLVLLVMVAYIFYNGTKKFKAKKLDRRAKISETKQGNTL